MEKLKTNKKTTFVGPSVYEVRSNEVVELGIVDRDGVVSTIVGQKAKLYLREGDTIEVPGGCLVKKPRSRLMGAPKGGRPPFTNLDIEQKTLGQLSPDLAEMRKLRNEMIRERNKDRRERQARERAATMPLTDGDKEDIAKGERTAEQIQPNVTSD